MIISGDLSPLSELEDGGSDSVPLYMRRAEPEPRHKPEMEKLQGRDQTLDCKSVKSYGILINLMAH